MIFAVWFSSFLFSYRTATGRGGGVPEGIDETRREPSTAKASRQTLRVRPSTARRPGINQRDEWARDGATRGMRRSRDRGFVHTRHKIVIGAGVSASEETRTARAGSTARRCLVNKRRLTRPIPLYQSTIALV